MSGAQLGYRSYLLRLWPSLQDNEPVWRVTLESVQTQQQWSFANLDECFAFLQEQGKISLESNQNTNHQDEEDALRRTKPP